MSFIQFESAREKEKMRQELREAREELLLKAQKSAEQRAQQQTQQDLKGETNWMLPTVAQKIEKLSKIAKPSKKGSKKKKCKKKEAKKYKKKQKHKSSTSDDSESDSSSAEEVKKRKKSKKKSRKRSISSSSSSPAPSTAKKPKKKRRSSSESNSTDSSPVAPDEWVERASAAPKASPQTAPQRDSWMTDSDALSLKTFSRERAEKNPNEKLQIDAYDPAKSGRELNPYWKTTGTGLPSFQKPRDDSDDEQNNKLHAHSSKPVASKSWRKPGSEVPKKSSNQTEHKNTKKPSRSSSESSSDSHSESDQPAPSNAASFLTDQQMNELGAKILKAEIMGNMELAQELRQKLETARSTRETLKARKQSRPEKQQRKPSEDEEHILLTHTDERGNTRPLAQSKSVVDPRDLYGGRKGKKQQKRLETHEAGQRVRYFADDDKYDIKQMFEREKYATAADSNLQFANIASKHKNPNDDLDDIFADKIRKNISKEDTDKKELSRAMHEQQKLSAQLESCDKCLDSAKMDKKSIVCMGDNVYLALPWHIGLQTGHCIIVPNMHVGCGTQLDEDTWEEIKDFRRALKNMFDMQGKDVIFYEIANKLHRKPHMAIHCIPIDGSKGEMAPFYFKKAIEESEHEWSVNKQLVSLRNRDLRKAIPKGLPYFWVNFGMDSGFAHVIEDQDRFPVNFAQEIIGGMLNLDAHKWRRPQKEQNIIAQVKKFAQWWKIHDCTYH